MILTQVDVDRFWSGVVRRGEDGCWEWARCRDKDGYGLFTLNNKMKKTHRVAYIIANGPIPELFEGFPTYVCHTCDTPPCCNPNHLFLGNAEINAKDSAAKDRKSFSRQRSQFFPRPWLQRDNLANRGENNGSASKTDLQIRAVKQDLKEGALLQKEIAEKHGLSCQTITNIKTGKCWSHVN